MITRTALPNSITSLQRTHVFQYTSTRTLCTLNSSLRCTQLYHLPQHCSANCRTFQLKCGLFRIHCTSTHVHCILYSHVHTVVLTANVTIVPTVLVHYVSIMSVCFIPYTSFGTLYFCMFNSLSKSVAKTIKTPLESRRLGKQLESWRITFTAYKCKILRQVFAAT